MSQGSFRVSRRYNEINLAWTFTPVKFNNHFFKLLLSQKWTKRKWNGPEQYESGDLMMLPSDIALLKDAKFKTLVEIYAKDQNKFFQDFSKAFEKLLELGMETNRAKM